MRIIPGSEAKRGDYVRNLTTGRVAKVTGTTDDGRLCVQAHDRWERWNVEVIATHEPMEGSL